MRWFSLALVCASSILVAACARFPGSSLFDRRGPQVAVVNDFPGLDQQTLMQATPYQSQPGAAASAGANQERFAVSTDRGIFMMTPMQFAQYSAIQRASSRVSPETYLIPYETVVARNAVNNPSAFQAAALEQPAAATLAAVSTQSRRAPGAFDPYIAPGLNLTQGPDGFKNADGTYDCVLTFDDGPHHSNDALILDILDQQGIKGVFFFLGEKVQSNPNTAKAVAARGHEIGYHSWDHKNLRAESLATVQDDFEKGLAVFRAVGLTPRFYRPPFGNYNSGILTTAKAKGMDVINWSNDSMDWKLKSAGEIKARVLNRNIPGDIILMHSIHSRSVEALPGIIDGLRAKGCRFTSLQSWVKRALS